MSEIAPLLTVQAPMDAVRANQFGTHYPARAKQSFDVPYNEEHPFILQVSCRFNNLVSFLFSSSSRLPSGSLLLVVRLTRSRPITIPICKALSPRLSSVLFLLPLHNVCFFNRRVVG